MTPPENAVFAGAFVEARLLAAMAAAPIGYFPKLFFNIVNFSWRRRWTARRRLAVHAAPTRGPLGVAGASAARENNNNVQSGTKCVSASTWAASHGRCPVAGAARVTSDGGAHGAGRVR